MTAAEDAQLRRRAYARASVVMVVVVVAVAVALALAFRDPQGRAFLVAFAALDRQAWLIAAASIATGCGAAAFVYARLSGRPPRAKR